MSYLAETHLLKRYLSVGAIVEFQHHENECFVKKTH